MDKVAFFNGFAGEIRSLKPFTRDEIEKLDDKELRTEHSWAHRFAGNIKSNPNWGRRKGWSKKKVERIHKWLVEEAAKREKAWAKNHKSAPFIRHKIRE